MDPTKQHLAQQAGNAVVWRGGSLVAEKLIFLVRLLIVARLVAPEDFGLVAIGMTIVTLVGELTNFGLIPALVQTPARQKHHLDTAWTISVMRGTGITLFLVAAAPFIADLFDEPRATNIIRALALATLLQSAISIEVATLTRSLNFRSLASIELSSAVINTAVSIYLAPTFGAWALVWGNISAAAVRVTVSYAVTSYRPAFRMSRDAARRLLRFGRWIFVASVLGVLVDTILRWMISKRLGVAELGLFYLAARLAFLPAQLTTNVLYDVAFPVYARLQDNAEKTARVFRAMLTSMLTLLLPACLIFLVLVPGLVEHVLGPRWVETTEIMQILVLASLVGVLGHSIVPLLQGTGRPDLVAGADGFSVVVLVCLAWGLIGAAGVNGAAIAYLLTVCITQVLLLLILRRRIRRPFADLMPIFLAIALAAVTGAVVAAAIAGAVPGVLGIGLSALGGGLMAVAIGLILDRLFGLGMLLMLSEPWPQLRAVYRNFIGVK